MSQLSIEPGNYAIANPSLCYYIGDLWRTIVDHCDITAMYSLRLVCKFFARDVINYASWDKFMTKYMREYVMTLSNNPWSESILAPKNLRTFFQMRRSDDPIYTGNPDSVKTFKEYIHRCIKRQIQQHFLSFNELVQKIKDERF